ncbi:translation initiation protein sua5 [Diplodia corticola]|uniref:Threonylcarbamoyl-AMP synthase n=1 Tax=Diplodia corticola TaxID=236234 RepID=A0A1J9SB90_9PEZI|nr:translation initiation protein sua5 [Diplodia corticola]OJD37124.1 translation initiation protein sua5 [Diplodia corticola]
MPTFPNACFLGTPTPLARLIRSPAPLRTGGIPAIPAARRLAPMSAPAAAVPEDGQHTIMPCETSILPIDASKLGTITLSRPDDGALLEDWDISWATSGPDIARLRQAAAELQDGALPVAFPTETVYGLGADATSSAAVRGIYTAKQRPADNPLIVHVASLRQLGSILRPSSSSSSSPAAADDEDVRNPASLIPKIYHPLIRRFWPGPLTLILPLPNAPSSSAPLAPEVTAGLSTFGARMPGSLIALLLIRLADRPLAAPSANASTKPSPTAAEHVAHDLRGRVATILDGGPCDVGVESTVVDGVSGDTPVILRPGGVSIDELRRCDGWERVGVAYQDKAEMGGAGSGDGKKKGRGAADDEDEEPAAKKRKKEAPRAPGMKYRHYSPKARVVLFEAGTGLPSKEAVEDYRKVGTIRTKKWPRGCGLPLAQQQNGDDAEQQQPQEEREESKAEEGRESAAPVTNGTDQSQHRGFSKMLDTLTVRPVPKPQRLLAAESDVDREIWEVNLGAETKDIARGLFSALRELDKINVDVIFVEGIDETEGDVAAAVMNRLRKAAEVEVKGS